MRANLGHFATMTVTAILTVGTTRPCSAAPPDDSQFRDGLRERGLTEWLAQYFADTPAVDPVDARLRERERLLQEAADAGLAPERPQLVQQAGGILVELLRKYPDHPGRLRWRMELALDFIDRIDPGAMDSLLLYEVSGTSRQRALALAGQAVEILERLRRDVAAAWQDIGLLDEASLQAATSGGGLRMLESLDSRSAYLLAWARFCQLLGGDLPAAERKVRARAMLAEVAQGSGWIQSPDPVQRCGALLMAAATARLAEQYDQADQFSLQLVNTYGRIGASDERARLRTASLAAVIEQIRTLRDRNRLNEALSYIEQTRRWAEKSRPEDLQAAMAVAWIHYDVLARRRTPASQPAGMLQPEDALSPLESFAKPSPQTRDALYALLSGTVADVKPASLRTPFGLQLLLGAMTIEATAVSASRPAASRPAHDARLADAIIAAQDMLATLPLDVSPDTRGEYLYLLGIAQDALGRPLDAVATFCDLGEQQPKHDRSLRAAALAVNIAERLLGGKGDLRIVRDAFVRAGRLLCKLSPESPVAKALPYYIASALEQNEQLDTAAEVYATVGPEDTQALAARVGRARCLRRALDRAVAGKTLTENQTRELADRAIQAARDAVATAERRNGDPDRHRRLAAETIVLLAGLLNHPMIDKSAESLTMLGDFEKQFPQQSSMLSDVWRERASALTRLSRYSEARQATERCLAVDPERAGPLFDDLLEAMRASINAALDRGDHDAALSTARQATPVAHLLLEWSNRYPQRVSPAGRLSVRISLAWTLQHAGRTDEALNVYDECVRQAATMPAETVPNLDLKLGRAECLLATGDARSALPLFVEAWQAAPERSAQWWRAFSGSLECHTRLGHDAGEILQAVAQQRTLTPDFGGPRWKRSLETIEKTNTARLERAPGS